MNILYSLRVQICAILFMGFSLLQPLAAFGQYVEGVNLQEGEDYAPTISFSDPPTADTLSVEEAEAMAEEDSVESVLARLRDVTHPLEHTTAYYSWLPAWLSMPLSTFVPENALSEEVLFAPVSLALKPSLYAEKSGGKSFFAQRGFSLQPFISVPHRRALDEFAEGNRMELQALRSLQLRRPDLIRETASDLLAHKVDYKKVHSTEAQIAAPETPIAAVQDPISGIQKILLPRRYWTFGWNSVVQFSQAYISPNWHKGGNSHFNLYNRQLFKADYKKDLLAWNNELEWKLSVYTSPADTVARYRVADDLLRFRSNVGLETPLKNFFYTLDTEVRTQFFKMREENKTKTLSDLFSPVIVTLGAGMKYVYEHKSASYYGRKLKLEVNLAPLAYDFRWTMNSSIDLTRHGFKAGERIYSAVGSMLRANLDFDITQSFTWRSRLYYNTSYKRIETEWENAFIFALSKYFSTRLNVHLRFDDAVPRTPENPSRIQINQLFSFGFEMNI